MKKLFTLLALSLALSFSAEARVLGLKKILDSESMGASFQSEAVDVSKVDLVSIQAVWSGGGAPNGTFTLEVSNDDVSASNWTTYPSSSIAIAADGSLFYNVASLGAKWVRIAYARTSGTGTVNAMLTTKEENDR